MGRITSPVQAMTNGANLRKKLASTRRKSPALFIAGEGDKPLKSLPDHSLQEIAFLVLNEKIVHLDDLVLRRTLLGMLGQLTRPALEELADIVGGTLGWTAPQKKSETARTLRLLSERHGVVLDWGDGSQPLK